VRFLRNVTVAKIAGQDSPLLQVSSDERARVGRIAGLFTEEELARHLQIMLRTHGELGYRQEQRFHLELGLLKMAHAQRLLPIEQLLSEAASSGSSRPAVVRNISAPTEPRRSTEPTTQVRSASVSPFAADSARKGTPRADSSGDAAAFAGGGARATHLSGGTNANVVIMGSAAPAVAEIVPHPRPEPAAEEPSEPERASSEPTAHRPGGAVTVLAASPAGADSLRDTVLSALANQPMLASLLERAQWSLDGNTLTAKVAASNTMIEMSFTAEARRIAMASASGQAGRPIRVQVITGGVDLETSQSGSSARHGASNGKSANGSAPNGSARSRAEQDPVVKRMQEKFGAEIRTVIDYREKGRN